MLSTLPCVEKVYPSAANFLLVALNPQPSVSVSIAQKLLEDYSIYVKDISHKFPDGKSYMRLAVRLPQENALLVDCLRKTWSAVQ
jgi:histidinol-phosphate/aromatic aminotransferase/cobyric acid decarboxylase-like protein